MNEKNRLKICIGALCIVALILAVVAAVALGKKSPKDLSDIHQTKPTITTGNQQDSTKIDGDSSPETEITFPTNQQQSTTDDTEGSSQETDPSSPTEEQITLPEDLPSSVVIPVEKDPQTGKPIGIQIPCQIPEYGLVIEKIASYKGMFVEDGTNINTENVAMLMVENNGDFPIEYTQIRIAYGQEELLFDVSALPVGKKLVVQEKTGKSMPQGNASSASATIVQRAYMEMSENVVQVTDNGNNTLTIKNLTDQTIPTVRVFYKYYMEDEGIFVGGIAFTVRVTRLGAGSSITVQPSHYTSQTSRVVMVLTYDTEV